MIFLEAQRNLTPRQLADIWNTSADEVRKLAREGMPHFKDKNGYYLFNRQECEAWNAGGWMDDKEKAS